MVETILLPVRIPVVRGVPWKGERGYGRFGLQYQGKDCRATDEGLSVYRGMFFSSSLLAALGAATCGSRGSVTTVTRRATGRPPRKADPR